MEDAIIHELNHKNKKIHENARPHYPGFDEITEMDLALQAKLLRVLQEREVERLGARKTVKLNVRVIATSNRDLRKAVDDSDFATLRRLGLNIAGAAGGYGFPRVSAAAKELELEVKREAPIESVSVTANTLIDLCGRCES